MAEFLYIKLGYWFIHSNAKPTVFWRNACILHDTGLEFYQATVSSKHKVHMYIPTGKIQPIYTQLMIVNLYS